MFGTTTVHLLEFLERVPLFGQHSIQSCSQLVVIIIGKNTLNLRDIICTKCQFTQSITFIHFALLVRSSLHNTASFYPLEVIVRKPRSCRHPVC